MLKSGPDFSQLDQLLPSGKNVYGQRAKIKKETRDINAKVRARLSPIGPIAPNWAPSRIGPRARL